MGVLSDFVIASDEEARSGLENIPDNTADRVEVRGANPVMIMDLDSVLSGKDLDRVTTEVTYTLADLMAKMAAPAQSMENLPLVFEGKPDGPWVYQMPPSLVQRLAALDQIAISETASRWSHSLQFKQPDWTLSKVQAFLAILVGLANKATEQGKCLYMWICC